MDQQSAIKVGRAHILSQGGNIVRLVRCTFISKATIQSMVEALSPEAAAHLNKRERWSISFLCNLGGSNVDGLAAEEVVVIVDNGTGIPEIMPSF